MATKFDAIMARRGEIMRKARSAWTTASSS